MRPGGGPLHTLLPLAGVVVVAIALVVAFSGRPTQTPVATPGPSGQAHASALPSLPAIPTVQPSGSQAATPTDAGATGAPTASAGDPWPTKSTVARRVKLVRLGISLQVVEGDGIDAPLGKAAHHPDTGWPGGGVNVFIYAHAQNGMFLPLWEAKLGDEVQLDLVTGTTVRYTVTKILPNAAWNDLELATATAGEKLTLETCTSYGPTAPRFVVIAEPITP